MMKSNSKVRQLFHHLIIEKLLPLLVVLILVLVIDSIVAVKAWVVVDDQAVRQRPNMNKRQKQSIVSNCPYNSNFGLKNKYYGSIIGDTNNIFFLLSSLSSRQPEQTLSLTQPQPQSETQTQTQEQQKSIDDDSNSDSSSSSSYKTIQRNDGSYNYNYYKNNNNNNQEQQRCRRALSGCVCLVTGGSRGIGKGIALELGKQGAIVYITGTSSTSSPSFQQQQQQQQQNNNNKNNNNDNNSNIHNTDNNNSTTTYTTATQYTNNIGISPRTNSNNNDNDNNNNAIIYPGTIEETAIQVTELGGKGIPLYCNHANDTDVRTVFQTIAHEQNGQLDILINNAFQTPKHRIGSLLNKFWENGTEHTWDTIHTVGLRSHYVATSYAMPLMFHTLETKYKNNTHNYHNNPMDQQKQQQQQQQHRTILPRPLVIMISSFGSLAYTFNTAYGVGKAGLDRLTKDMAIELKEANKDIAVISLWPGLVRTEVNDIYIKNGDWDTYINIPRVDTNFESTQFTGKAVVALALDSTNIQYTGTYQVVAELANKYKFTDVNGNVPPSIRSLRFLLPTYVFDETLRTTIPAWLIPDWKIPFWFMSMGGKAPSKQQK